MICGAIMGVMAPALALGAAPQCVSEGSCASDINSLLQVSAHTNKAVIAHTNKAAAVQARKQVPLQSFVDNTEFMCWHGSRDDGMDEAVAYPRGTSMAQMNSHTGLVDATCQDRGYTQLVASRDACYFHNGASSFVRPGTTQAQLDDFQTYVHGLIQTNLNARGLSQDLGMRWTTCLPCGGGLPGQVYRWWGATRAYSPEECVYQEYTADVLAAMQAAQPRRGAFESDGGEVCFEGEYSYMAATLAMTKGTPFGFHFGNAVVHEATCVSMGYSSIRDLVDECWPMSTKLMRVETEEDDMSRWVGGYVASHRDFDTAHGLPAGLAVNLTSCFSCQAGGANRDRGMLSTLEGDRSNGGFFTAQCEALFQTACTQYPGALSQDLCTAGFSAVFAAQPFDPVPVLP